MSVKEKINTEKINSEGFVAIAELKENYVYLQPAGVHLSKIWVVQRNLDKHGVVKQHASVRLKFKSGFSVPIKPELAKDTKNRLLGRISKSLKLAPSFKLYPKRNLLEYSKLIEDASVGIRGIVNADFENNFYGGSYRAHTRIPYISNSRVNILVEIDLVFKFLELKSPYSDKVFSILFKPSPYLTEERDIWKLIVILGEKFFTEQLAVNHSIVNETFIYDSFSRSSHVFYISRNNRKVFASCNERIKHRNPDLEQIPILSLLKIENADVNLVEEALEKGDIKF